MAAGKPHCGRPAREGTVSQRRPIVPRVVEGTEILVSAVALFGKVSADRAVGFIFHNLRAVLRWAGSLGKRPTSEPSWVCLLFVEAFPGGTPVAWPPKKRFSIDPPPTTTIWTSPGAQASPKWASSPGRRGEAQQRWDPQSSGSWRTSTKSWRRITRLSIGHGGRAQKAGRSLTAGQSVLSSSPFLGE